MIETSDDFVLYVLEAANVAILPGEAYGVDGFFRISFASSVEVLEECCARIARATAQLT